MVTTPLQRGEKQTFIINLLIELLIKVSLAILMYGRTFTDRKERRLNAVRGTGECEVSRRFEGEFYDFWGWKLS
jgi:hypothetical protein